MEHREIRQRVTNLGYKFARRKTRTTSYAFSQVTTKGDNNTRAEKSRSLDDWIRYTEKQRPPHDIRKGDAKRLLLTLKPPTEPDDQPSKSALIGSQLEMLWADVKFWKLVSSSNAGPLSSQSELGLSSAAYRRLVTSRKIAPTFLKYHPKSHHHLFLPEYPPQVWKRLVTASAKRTKLFNILCQQEWRWLGDDGMNASGLVRRELKAKGFQNLVDCYFQDSNFEMTRALASQEFSRRALLEIRAMTLRLKKDVNWCLKKPGKIPPDKERKLRGKPTDLIVTRRVEDLVKLRRARPDLLDSKAMRAYIGKEKNDGAVRKSAAIARQLLWFREGIKVGEGVKDAGK